MLKDIGLLAVDNIRTRAYMDAMIKHRLLPSQCVFVSENRNPHYKNTIIPNELFENQFEVVELAKRENLPFETIEVDSFNSQKVADTLTKYSQNIWIYSGPSGVIVGTILFDTGKKFLHIHPGLIPNYRGSTTIYYSLLMENEVGASAFFLNPNIDEGDVIMTKRFPPPRDRTTIDLEYDPYVRSCLLVDVLKHYQKNEQFSLSSQNPKEGQTYYIIHPVLKHIAILSNQSNQ